MLITRAHNLFKIKFNKLNSQHKPDFPDAYIDEMLYRGLLDYIDIFYSANNMKQLKLGFETTQQRLDMLQNFIKPYDLSAPNSSTEFEFNKYEFDLPEDYIHNIRMFSNTTCGYVPIAIERHDHISEILLDEYLKPNLNWKRLVGIINQNKVYVYSDKELTNIMGEYIRLPNIPFLGTYDSIEFSEGDSNAPNIIDGKIHLDIPEMYAEKVIDIAVYNVSGIFGDYNYTQYLTDKLQKTT
jgi:hypothetical protein